MTDGRHAERGERPIVRADHHGSNEKYRRVEQDSYGCDGGGNRHEDEERGRQGGPVSGARLELLPHQRVTTLTGRSRFRLCGCPRDNKFDCLNHDCASAMNAMVLETLDDPVRRFTRDVTEHHLPVGSRGRAGTANEMDHTRRRRQLLDDNVD